MSEIKLGCLARDRVTGFSGIVTSITNWLNGCVRVGIQPRELHEGKPIEAQAFYLEQVEYVDAGVNVKSKATGGDRPIATRPSAPR